MYMTYKRTRIKVTHLQRGKYVGGLNFKLYFQALEFLSILNWFRHYSSAPWLSIKRDLVSLMALEELVSNDVSLKQCKLTFGPIIDHIISIGCNI